MTGFGYQETMIQRDDPSWLGSAHGTESAEGFFINRAVGFVEANHYPDGFLRSGYALGQITTAGATQYQVGLWDPDAVDGRAELIGHLLKPIDARSESPAITPCAVLTHGKVKVYRLPANHGLAGADLTAAKASVAGRIRYLEV